MTSISANSYSFTSPRDLLQTELTKEISSGKISAEDKDALSSALDDIDSSLRGSGRAGRSSGAPPSPDEMQSKIDDLIDAKVDSGTLTSDQASELKAVFQNAFANGPQGGAGGPGGPGGAGGPGGPGGPQGLMPSGDSDESDESSDSTSDATATDITQLLKDFLSALQKDSTQSSSYSGDGKTQSDFSSLLFDYQA